MKFSYYKVTLPKRSDFFGMSILKPIIPVDIKANDKKITYGVLIDSGADFCIFDAEIGEYLKLDVKSGTEERFGGIEGSAMAVAYLHKVVINIGGYDYKTIVGFSYDIAKFGYAILGQKGFFDMFSVKFDYQKEEIELKEKSVK